MGNGEFRPPGEPKLLNRLRWNLAWVITSVTPPHIYKTKSVRKGVWGWGEMFTSSVLFGSLNGPPAYPVRISWALSALKNVFWW